MEQLLETITLKLAAQTPVLAVAFGINWIMGLLLMRAIEGRIGDLKDRIGALEKAVKDCQDDREKLWSRLVING